MPDELAAPLASAAERMGVFAGAGVQWFAELPSTNDAAARCAERGAHEGLVVIADAQTAGRGRHGRAWCSPPGAGLYVSAVLRPSARAVPLLTIAAGVALADGIRASTGLVIALKWPNDLMMPAGLTGGAAKLGGILAEGSTSPRGGADRGGAGQGGAPRGSAGQGGERHGGGERGAARQARDPIAHVVLGFGINVRPAAYPPELAARATSLERELGREVDRGAVLAECLASLAARYDDVQGDRCAEVLDAWRGYARPFLGRPVECDGPGGAIGGIAEDVDRSGALMVRTVAGIVRVISGEVRWR